MALKYLEKGVARKAEITQFTHLCFLKNRLVTYNEDVCVIHPVKGLEFEGSVPWEEFSKIVDGSPDGCILELNLRKAIIRKKECMVMHILGAGLKKIEAEVRVEEDDRVKQIIETMKLEEEKEWVTVDAEIIRALTLCKFSASKNIHQGAFFCVSINDDQVLSADGIRISRYFLKNRLGLVILIPAPSVDDLKSFPAVEMAMDKKWVIFRSEEGVSFCTKIFPGELIDLSPYLKVEGEKIEPLPKKEMMEVVHDVAFMVGGESDLQKMVQITMRDGEILARGSKDVGWVEKMVPVKIKDKDGKEIDTPQQLPNITFHTNPTLVQDVLDKKGSYVILGKEAVKFVLEDEEDHFEHVIGLANPKVNP